MKRKKEHLIPLEKSKRVIYLEQRGKEKKRSVGAVILGILGIVCFVYCLCIAFFMGYGTKFFLIWGALAAVFGVLSLILAHREWLGRIPVWLKAVFVICAVVGIVFFTAVETAIFSQFHARANADADYLIVLGAQWKQNGPSYVLQKRLDTAVTYLEKNPDTIVIVSGGQGNNELISEAEGMKGYLMQAGIAEERILLENQSVNTCENLVYSGQLLDKTNDRVVLVTNNFHMFRALQIAKKQGYLHIEGLASSSYPAMMPNNLLREFFGVVKDFLVGNL